MDNIHRTLNNAANRIKAQTLYNDIYGKFDSSTPNMHNVKENFVNHIDPYAKDRAASQMQRVDGKWTVVML